MNAKPYTVSYGAVVRAGTIECPVCGKKSKLLFKADRTRPQCYVYGHANPATDKECDGSMQQWGPKYRCFVNTNFEEVYVEGVVD